MCSATRALTTGPMHVTNAANSKKPRFAVAVTDKPCGLRPVTRSLPTPLVEYLTTSSPPPRRHMPIWRIEKLDQHVDAASVGFSFSPVSVPTAANLNRRDLRILGGRPHTTPYLANTLFRLRQPSDLAGEGRGSGSASRLSPPEPLTFWCIGPWRSCTGRR
jgi:hypothetical protein